MNVTLKLTKEQLAKLQELGIAPAPEKPVQSAPETGNAAQAVKDRLAKLGAKVSKADKDGRVGCAYGKCDKRFLPNGIGAWDHTGCEIGTVYYTALADAKKSGDQAKFDAILADAKAQAESMA